AAPVARRAALFFVVLTEGIATRAEVVELALGDVVVASRRHVASGHLLAVDRRLGLLTRGLVRLLGVGLADLLDRLRLIGAAAGAQQRRGGERKADLGPESAAEHLGVAHARQCTRPPFESHGAGGAMAAHVRTAARAPRLPEHRPAAASRSPRDCRPRSAAA